MTSLPIEEFRFCLHKGAFFDALALRYGWSPSRTPMYCECRASFTVEHALSCQRGGFPISRHNKIRDVTANLLTEVCHDVVIEPDLQPLTGEVLARATANTSDGARLDIAANGFWGGCFEKTYMDVRVFNPHAPTNRSTSISNCYRKHEAEKKRAYEQRIREVYNRTLNFHSLGVLCYWGHGQAYHDLLPAASLPFSRQVGIPVQLYSLLASIPNRLLSSAVGNSVHQRCPLFSWTRRRIALPPALST